MIMGLLAQTSHVAWMRGDPENSAHCFSQLLHGKNETELFHMTELMCCSENCFVSDVSPKIQMATLNTNVLC